MKRQATATMPTDWGQFTMVAYATEENDPMPHIAMVHENFNPDQPTWLRIHSECMTGDLFHSHRCDCGEQLDQALQVAAKKGGVVLYLRQEGRGIGLINKLKAYNLQDAGLNTVQANTHLNLPVDDRRYDDAVMMMEDLGIQSIHLLTNNPEKIQAINDSPIQVLSREPLIIPSRAENEHYLDTKKDIMGHLFS